MNMIVCVKEILDPEIPAKLFKVDAESQRAIKPSEIKLVISDYDESAMEAALKIKDAVASKITVISLGSESAKIVIRHCIAMGGDEGILLSDPLFIDNDSYGTAFVLAEAIKKIGDYDLILCGRQEGDWDAGQVGSGIAELLGIPSITIISGIEVRDGKIVVERVLTDGRETVEVTTPALVTVSSEVGEPRYPNLRRIRESYKKEVVVWTAQHVAPAKAKNRMLSLTVPTREAKCEFITGATPEEAGTNLALKLKEAKLI